MCICVCVCARVGSCDIFSYREVLGEPAILNMPERVDWRSCKSSKEEESSMAAVFKEKFRAFDFNFF